jgi:uncharacterized protein YndB with AHSA1/START domain
MTKSPESDDRIVGSLRRLDNERAAVRVEDIYDTDIDDLWSALTDSSRLAHWIATVEGDLRPGGRFHAHFTSTYEGPGRIDVCEAPRRLLVTLDPGTSEETVIEARLSPIGNQTRLVIEERGLLIGEIAAHGAGWQAHVEDLASHLSGRRPGAWQRRWAQLTPTYEEMAEGL